MNRPSPAIGLAEIFPGQQSRCLCNSLSICTKVSSAAVTESLPICRCRHLAYREITINTRQNAAQSFQAGSVVNPRRELRRGRSSPPPTTQEEAIVRSETYSAISSDDGDETVGSAGRFHHAVPAASDGSLTCLGIEKRYSRLLRPDSRLRALFLPLVASFAECDALRVVDRRH